jgi:hypothetical protein
MEGALGNNGLPATWRGVGEQPNGGYQFRVVEGGRSGDKSLSIQGKGRFGVVSTNFVQIDPKMRYRARGWVKIEGEPQAAADVKFHYFDADRRYLGQTRIPFVAPPTKEWTQLEVTDRVAEFPKAKWIQVAVALAGNGKASYDDLELTAHRRDQLPTDFDLSPHQRVLNRWTGSWKSEVAMKPAIWTPKGLQRNEAKSARWILKQQFLEQTGRDLTPGGAESRAVFAYDRANRVFRSWFFGSVGAAYTSSGRWDEATLTMTWEGKADSGHRISSSHHFIDKDTYTFTFKIMDEKGRTYMEGKATHRRVNE